MLEIKVGCPACACSGVYIGYDGPRDDNRFPAYACKLCNGEGWVEESKAREYRKGHK
jgi:hypothetical protein